MSDSIQVALSAPSSEAAPLGDSGKDAGIVGAVSKAHNPLFELFGLTRASDYTNPHHNEALAKIWQYAKSVAENKDADSIKWEVMRLKNRLGSGGIENNPYLKMEMYVTAWNQAHSADLRMRELEASKE